MPRPIALTDHLIDALEHRDFLMLVLSRSLSGGTASHKVTVKPVNLREGRMFQWSTRAGTQERHENLTRDEFLERAGQTFAKAFGDAHLFTKRADLTVRVQPHGRLKWKTKPPSKLKPAPVAHNREKNYLIPAGTPCPFLERIGVMTATGQVRASMSAKFRQINRYLEFIADVLPSLPAEGPIRVVDFGCGKSYLTFALHHFLTAVHQREVRITGLDLKTDVMEHCATVARELNCTGLEFLAGEIASYQPDGPVHLAISLHACDTATDDAIAAALGWKCGTILAVPCCQHEVHQQLRADSVPGLTEYGLIRERFAALATDALRAQFLESRGYKTQVLEFIDMEHTPKNVLLRAVQRDVPDARIQAAAAERLAGLKSLLGLTTWRLEQAATR